MIKNWLEKMKSIFQSLEVDEPKQSTYQRQEIKARMTYKYPEKRNFRFPVIPDHPVDSVKDKQTPVHARRKRKAPQPSQQHEVKRVKHAEPQSRKVTRDENAPPFKVTEVPSPVYGFQKKKVHDDNVPAFVRKREEQINIKEKQLQEETMQVEDIQEVLPPTAREKTEMAASLESGVQEKESAPILEATPAPEEEFKTIQQLAKEEITNTPVHNKRHQQRSMQRSKKQWIKL